jgi:hypothetical protein
MCWLQLAKVWLNLLVNRSRVNLGRRKRLIIEVKEEFPLGVLSFYIL